MDNPQPDIKTIFGKALDIDSDASRAAFLDAACAGNEALRAEVESLLAALHQAGSYLDAPAVARTIDMPGEPPISAAPGTVIGPYKLLQQIGEGGMGVVYMAEQAAPVRRKVALKIIKPGMDTGEVIARFEAERQALALMDHPNIAKVFDGGSTDAGRPYFVMELVRGVPLTDYCDQNNLPVHERLELFITVCHAVQHAHQKGIIHRDIKPSNVLVTLHDGRPVPKVIDFGVAKAIGQQLTEKTLFTQFAQMVGTPLYMSPEQAELTGLDIDTRGDIYSLGVMLYELLTGTTPFEGGRMKKAALDEIRRMIREEDPPSPSTRLSSTAGEAQTAVAAHRRVDPRGLSRLVRGDLDWIVMKALEKDRNRRYETANNFAADIGRYLSDEPVEACPPSAAYRFRKFARRNRAGLVTTSVVGVTLLVATSAIGWTIRDRSAQQAEMEQERAAARQQLEQERLVRQAKLEERVSQALDETQVGYERDRLPEALTAVKRAEALLASDSGVSNEIRQRVDQWRAELTILERLEELGFHFSRDDSRETDAAYSKVFLDIGINIDELPVEEAGQRIRSHVTWQRLTEALDRWTGIRHELAWLEKSSADASRSDENVVPELGFRRKQRLLQVARAADSDDLRSQARLAVEMWDIKAALRLSESPDVIRLPASTLRQLAMLLYFGEGDSHRKRAVQLLENAQVQRPGDFQLAMACANYYGRMDPPRWAEVAHYYSIAIALRPADARVQAWLADVYSKQGKVDEANACYRRALELGVESAVAHNNLGAGLCDQGRFDEAMASCQKAVELDPTMALAHLNLGRALKGLGKPEEAIARYQKAIDLSPNLAVAHNYLGVTLRDQGKPDAAMASYRKAIELQPSLAMAHYNLGSALDSQGKIDEALVAFREAIRLKSDYAAAFNGLGIELGRKGDLDSASGAFRKAIELKPDFAAAYGNLGTAQVKQRRLDDAIVNYRKATELDPGAAEHHFNLGNALRDRKKGEEALAAYQRAIELKPEYADAYNALGNGLLDQKKLDGAVAAFRRAIELEPHVAGFHSNLGIALQDQKKLDEAIDAFHKAIELDPAYATAHFNLGNTLRDQKKLEEAVASYRKAIELDPGASGIHNNLGLALQDQKNLTEAIASYRKAIELDPHNAAAWFNMGNALFDQEQLAQAVAAYHQAIELKPDYPNAYTNLGAALHLQGKPDEALVFLRKAIELDPGIAMAHFNLGVLISSKGKHEEAMACLRTAIELDANNAQAYRALGLLLLESGRDYDGAGAAFRRLVELQPEQPDAWANLGSALYGAGRFEDAVAALRDAIRLNPDKAELPSLLSQIRANAPDAKLRDPHEALELARKAVKLNPRSGLAWQALGLARYRSRDWQAGIEALEKSIEVQPDGADAMQWFFLAMSHRRLDHQDQARQWFDKAVQWMEKNAPENGELRRFRAEAAELLGLTETEGKYLRPLNVTP